jgi:DNA-binding MarR family transcriptional regulator
MDDKPLHKPDLRQIIWSEFLYAHAKVGREIDAGLADAGALSMDWYDVLLTLERSPEHRLRLNELAERVLISRSGLTRLIDRIEAAGLLRRERSVQDRRGAYAVLTSEGAAALGRAWPVYERLIEDHFGKFMSDDEAPTLHRFFSKLMPAPVASEPVQVGIRRSVK